MHIDLVTEIFRRNMTTLVRESAARRRGPSVTAVGDDLASVPMATPRAA
jgi:hypothetical protein